jgi:flagellar protein FlaJ
MKELNLKVDEIAYNLFGSYFTGRRARFSSLRDNIMKARLNVPVELWLSRAVFYSLLGMIVALAIYLSLRAFILMLTNTSFGLIDVILAPMILVITLIAVFGGFYAYPGVEAGSRGGRIDKLLPYAIEYVFAMASVGVIPYEIFKKLSNVEENYGEVSIEARHVVRDVELLGFDFITALRNLVAVTPSQKMKVFLQGAITTTLSGGELDTYFISTAEEYLEERRRNYADIISLLGILAEFYVTGLVAAPILMLVMLSVMFFLGSGDILILAIIVYGLIPFGSAGFIVLVGMWSW